MSDNLKVTRNTMPMFVWRDTAIGSVGAPCLLRDRIKCLYRSVAKQMLNIGNGSTSTQQASGKGLSQIV